MTRYLFLFVKGGNGSRGDADIKILGTVNAFATTLTTATTTQSSGPSTVPPEQTTINPSAISTLSRNVFYFGLNQFSVFNTQTFSFSSYVVEVSLYDSQVNNYTSLFCNVLPYELVCSFEVYQTTYLDRNIIVTLNSTVVTRTFPITMVYIDSISQVNDTFIIDGDGFDKLPLALCYLVIQAGFGNYSYGPVLISSTSMKVPIIDDYKNPMNGTLSFTMYSQIVYGQTLPPFIPFISSISPSPPLIKLDTVITLKGVFFFPNYLGSLVFNSNYMQEQTLDSYTLDPSTETIMYINGSLVSYYFFGVVSLAFRRNNQLFPFSNTASNSINLLIAKPVINDMYYNLNEDMLIVSGIFLNPTIYEITLNGLIFNTNNIVPNISTSTENTLYFKNPQLYYSSAFLICSNTSSNNYTQFKSQLIPTSVITNKIIKRSDKIIYLSGSFLLPNDTNNNPIYTINIINDILSIPCYNIKVLKYIGFKQLYNISCQVDNTLASLNKIQFKMVDTSVAPINFTFTFQPTTITSVSSTIYKKPGIVTIKGTSFCSVPTITIGGGSCSQGSLQLSTVGGNDIETITCNFQSDVGQSNSTLLVSIICDSLIVSSSESFIYIRDDPCPSSSTGICSGLTNGKCNEESRQCECNSGYSGFSCSNKIDVVVSPPIPQINQTKTIIETGVQFEIGIIQIREIQSFNDNKVVKSINLRNEKWNLITKSTATSNDIVVYTYGLIVNNNKTIINVQIMINSRNETLYDFLGDTFTLLPNSVKYQVEIIEWDFGASLNSIQVLFESKIINDKCVGIKDQELSKNIQMNGQSIRTIEMKSITGDILVGTFSNRLQIDDRVVVSSIEILSENDLLSSNISTLNNQSVIQAITINYFKTKAIIDPNFGVLLSNDPTTPTTNDGCNSSSSLPSSNKFATWKIAVIVVCSVVGVSLIIISTSIIYKKIRNKSVILNIRLKLAK
ncbi:hypothetical protein ACTA71_011036 [Dictyostelium dimigraforme]